MPYTFEPTRGKKTSPAYYELRRPLRKLMKKIKKLKSRSNRPLQMDFEEMLDTLIYFHLEEHESGRHLVQALEEDKFAREVIAPSGIKKSSFFEAINSRGLEQLLEVFEGLSKDAKKILPSANVEFGDLVDRLGIIDGVGGLS